MALFESATYIGFFLRQMHRNYHLRLILFAFMLSLLIPTYIYKTLYGGQFFKGFKK